MGVRKKLIKNIDGIIRDIEHNWDSGKKDYESYSQTIDYINQHIDAINEQRQKPTTQDYWLFYFLVRFALTFIVFFIIFALASDGYDRLLPFSIVLAFLFARQRETNKFLDDNSSFDEFIIILQRLSIDITREYVGRLRRKTDDINEIVKKKNPEEYEYDEYVNY
ncbi:hypothetical protein [Campylobacter pinnipediorum]|uniref:Uncharacterized protein n=1 Tax=Campylobacter pinnipediorum subsp. pinnipediorum TaxID=1660067 RepID=A0AAX0LAS7_9BACT|nr:hypothetical protein [Campylobacter pinnipediorum]OPA77357.1 hypothetical protein BFG04_04485 [Campylobacter pinnipediorum subsp. pinnipediorum]